MVAQQVGLFYHHRLLGEGIERLLLGLEGVELIGRWPIDARAISRLKSCQTDLVIIVEDRLPPPNAAHQVAHLTAEILEHFNDLPVIQIFLEDALVRVYSSQTLPARSRDLVQAIRQFTP